MPWLGRIFECHRRWYKPWFYKHVQTYLEQRKEGVEYLPVRDYYHRHTRGYFWAMEEIIPFGNHPIFRALLGWALPPRIELLKYTETETTRRLREKYHVIQDMLMPIRYLKQSISYFDEHFRLYPYGFRRWRSRIMAAARLCAPFQDGGRHSGRAIRGYRRLRYTGKEGFDNAIALPLLEKFVIEHRATKPCMRELP